MRLVPTPVIETQPARIPLQSARTSYIFPLHLSVPRAGLYKMVMSPPLAPARSVLFTDLDTELPLGWNMS